MCLHLKLQQNNMKELSEMLLVDIDFCSLADLDDIYAIEEAAHKHPWPYEIIESDLRHKTGQIFYIGARWNGVLCGFGACRREKSSLKIMNLAVHPDFRRNKIGTQLLIAMGEIGIRLGCKRATLEVRITNYAAQLLYEELGFRRIKVIPHYYEDSEDAFLMESPLPFPAISVATKNNGTHL